MMPPMKVFGTLKHIGIFIPYIYMYVYRQKETESERRIILGDTELSKLFDRKHLA
jgi:hypothetical protein